MSSTNNIDYLIAVPTFVGSLLSFLGSSTAIAFQISRPPQQHFRHSLILNLLVAGMTLDSQYHYDLFSEVVQI